MDTCGRFKNDVTLRLDSGTVFKLDNAQTAVGGIATCPEARLTVCKERSEDYGTLRGHAKLLTGKLSFAVSLAGNSLGRPKMAAVAGRFFVQDIKSGEAWMEEFTVDDIPVEDNTGK
jgi:hypothetical protein